LPGWWEEVKTIQVIGNATLDGDVSSDKIFRGQGTNRTTITIDTLANVQGIELTNATVTGILDGGVKVVDCMINDISYVDGLIRYCGLAGTIELSGVGPAILLDCWDGTKGTSPPIIDYVTGTDLIIRNYTGSLNMINKSGTDRVSIDMNSGVITLENTVTNGIFVIRGVGDLVDNSTGTTIDASNLLNPASVTDSVWNIQKSTITTAGAIGKEMAAKKDVINAQIVFGS